METNIANWTHFTHNHDEADTLLLCIVHELYLLSSLNGIFVRMISPDTDVFVLCVALIASLIDSSKLQIVFDLQYKEEKTNISKQVY